MKTLVELYGSSPELTDNVNLARLMFTTAFSLKPQEVAEQKKELSELTISPLMDEWHNRLATELSNHFDRGEEPDLILRMVPWVKPDEVRKLMAAIDEFLP